jgi:hypothetical protein
MKIIESFEEFEKELRGIESNLNKLKSHAQFLNRLTTHSSKGDKLSDEYEEMFYTLMDDGWRYYKNGSQFHGEIILRKAIKREEAENELSNILREMSEIKSRFIDNGFNCNFLIDFDGQGQSVLNKETNKNDKYAYQGIGNKNKIEYFDNYYPKEKFPSSKYFIAEIKFAYI